MPMSYGCRVGIRFLCGVGRLVVAAGSRWPIVQRGPVGLVAWTAISAYITPSAQRREPTPPRSDAYVRARRLGLKGMSRHAAEWMPNPLLTAVAILAFSP